MIWKIGYSYRKEYKMTINLSGQEKDALRIFKDGGGVDEISLSLGLSYQGAVNLMNNILTKTGYSDKKTLLDNAELYLTDTQN